jgi:hypothetical protein
MNNLKLRWKSKQGIACLAFAGALITVPMAFAEQNWMPNRNDPAWDALLSQFYSIAARHQSELVKLKNDYAQIRIGPLVAPSVLVDAVAIHRSKEVLRRFDALVQEPAEISRAMYGEMQQAIRESAVPPEYKIAFLQSIEKDEVTRSAQLKNVRDAEIGMANAARNLLKMFEKNFGKMQEKNGELYFQTREQFDYYHEQFARLRHFGELENKAFTEIEHTKPVAPIGMPPLFPGMSDSN